MRSTAALQRQFPIERATDADAPCAVLPAELPCQFEVVTTRAEFDALSEDWDALFAGASTAVQAFQTFNWNWHWCNHYLAAAGEKGPSLAVLTGRRGGRLVMVWPIVVERIAGLVEATWMGAPVSQYGDVLIDDVPDAAALLRQAWSHLLDTLKPDVVWLNRVREDAAITPLLIELGAIAARRLHAPYLDLSSAPDFDTYMLRHSNRTAKKRRNTVRRLAKLGNVEFVRETNGETARELAGMAIDSKHAQLVERGIVSPALADPRMRKFFSDAAGGSDHPADVIVYALEIDGERAAIDVLVACKDRIATHVFAYDPKFAKDRVGAHLLELTMARSLEDGVRIFDLLAPADPYKQRWADGMVEVVDWALPVSVKGTIYARIYLQRLRPLLKAAAHALPTRLARWLASAYAKAKSLS